MNALEVNLLRRAWRALCNWRHWRLQAVVRKAALLMRRFDAPLADHLAELAAELRADLMAKEPVSIAPPEAPKP